ncbi:glycosyltransferase [Paracoccus sp. TK19116]|uniref:Glycosyltransferase n=1 Tax=Paracoccus albicereus TaxID=2922394 RepID=A0ABT1MMU1_9RHOB|nr:glycosyltransferase family 2 protein [Paracoccus albicereus]MCQ0969592.1 glycosyltransferase [Paracoccus albicereus]
MPTWIMVGTAVLALVLYLPWLAVGLCVVALALQIAVIAARVVSGVLRPCADQTSGRGASGAPQVFSVHVATHEEPPELVIATLRSLAAQTWPQDCYEVIVIDNNTADPALWRPVERACATMGPQFRFMHRMGVKGAKAGALTIALAERRHDTTHIVTVDADYVCTPHFLSSAADALTRTGADYVQFPQAYRGAASLAGGIGTELEEYFRTHATVADGAEAVLLTGTLSVVSVEALHGAGGWSARTITEDAELGVRLCHGAYVGRYVAEVVGKGLLPLSLGDLQQQRYRWTRGNLQALWQHAALLIAPGAGLSLRQRAAILTQLTAWLNLSMLPGLALVLALLTNRAPDSLVWIAAASVILGLCDILLRLSLRGWRDSTRPRPLLAAICNRLALTPVAARASLDALTGRKATFRVTDKSGNGPRTADLPLAQAALFAIALIAVIPAAASGPMAMAAIFTLMLPLPAALVTARTLKRYRAAVQEGQR